MEIMTNSQNYAATPAPQTAPQTEQNDLLGKSVAGYQCWFKGSESADSGWHHWSGKSAPARGHLTFEVYPDVSEYDDEVMVPTKFDVMPDGTPSRLFRSRTPHTIDVQFGWMEKYGVDGAAIQRFYSDAMARDQYGELRDDAVHLTWIREAAERHNRLFYLMYDVSGAGRAGMEVLGNMQRDVVVNLEEKGIISSPMYAHANGRPVLCIWGLNSRNPERYPGAAVMLPFVQWLKQRGYFVIGGISDNDWVQDDSDFGEVYRAVDMISPWTIGRYGPNEVEAWQAVHMRMDMDFCRQYDKIYQPVMFPGFAWSNWNGGPANHIPRQSGEFLWKQARLYAQAGVRNAYFAMFDEYDEGTAIMKAAEDSYSIPTGEQYFQTLSVDGQWLSSDFYLRLAGEISRMLRGEAPCTEQVTIPYSEGPVYWRNGFERRYVPVRRNRETPRMPVLANVDVCTYHPALVSAYNAEITAAEVAEGMAATGKCSFRFFVRMHGAGELWYKLADTRICVTEPLRVRYTLNPQSLPATRVQVALLLEDGKRMAVGTEARVDRWNKLTVSLPAELVGHTIIGIGLTVNSDQAGYATAYVDDMVIEADK